MGSISSFLSQTERKEDSGKGKKENLLSSVDIGL
jgi:hypothetical protein